jgi:hypothetical protein
MICEGRRKTEKYGIVGANRKKCFKNEKMDNHGCDFLLQIE